MNRKKAFVTAVILAAGSGTRMGGEITKQKITLLGESILSRTLKSFSECDKVDAIVVVCKDDEKEWVRSELENKFDKITSIVSGGNSRAESARIGFSNIPIQTDYVAIHDAARCLITQENISSVIEAALKKGASTAATRVSDTVKLCTDGIITKTLPRDNLYLASTPQVFSCDLYKRAIEGAVLDSDITDDNMLVERIGVEISVVDVGKENIKITTPEDIGFAEYIIKRRSKMDEIRVGHGYDVHRFAEGRRLVLGGVEIPCDKGLLGHSDADVLLHAIMDAMLGACGLGDIGRHFPDSDKKYKDISSLTLLGKTTELVGEQGYVVNNIDATIVMQSPKIAPYVEHMVLNISKILGIESGRVNIKATTEEHLGFTGRLEGVSAHAVVTLKK